MKIIILKGGLGNQLFQFCVYLELIKNNNVDKVFIDNKTGFLLDFKYKRKFELFDAISKELLNPKFNYFLNIFLILSQKFSLNKIFEFFRIKIIDDNEFLIQQSTNKKQKNRRYLIFNGYFHNFKRVDENFSELVKYIKPYLLKKVDKRFEILYKNILSEKNSVALCIRLYEETKDPSIHAFDGKEIKPSQFNKAIKEIEKKLSNPHFFIFIQNQNKFIESLEISSRSTIISNDKGFNGSWETLRAQSYCKHHIFNNSTFYFWGAILSKYWGNHKNVDQIIYASNNFMFKEIYNPEWEKF